MDRDDRDGFQERNAMSKEDADLARPTVIQSADTAAVPIGDGWSAELSPRPRGALLRVMRGLEGQALEIIIALTADGPVIRARAAALEIESDTDLVARCERFRVEARQAVDIISGGSVSAQGRRMDLEATHGSVRVRANDDVQLLGENVLLNCDRPAPVPRWAIPVPTVPEPSLPVQESSGDEALLSVMRGEG
jgi:hypothetical protein